MILPILVRVGPTTDTENFMGSKPGCGISATAERVVLDELGIIE